MNGNQANSTDHSDLETARDPLGRSVADAQAGDPAAQEHLYRACCSGIFGLMVRMVGSQEAEDLTQQVFLKAFQKIGQFQGKSRFQTWLYRLAVNEALQRIRRRRRPEASLEMDVPDRNASNGQVVEDRELLQRALNEIDPELRTVFLLKEQHGQSYREIAHAVGIPVGTVGSRLNRARQQLRDLLVDLGWGNER